MPHISKIGRKSFGARLAFTLMYLLLGIGGITMIIPFMIWLSNSFKSNVDSQTLDLIPAYWHRQDILTKKYFEQQTNYDLTYFNALARSNVAKMIEAEVPAQATSQAECADYRYYLKGLPETYTTLGNRGLWNINPLTYGTHPVVYDYRRTVLAKYHTLSTVELQYSMPLGSEEQLNPPAENWFSRSFQPQTDDRMLDFLNFKELQPIDRLTPVPAESVWNNYLRTKIDADVKQVNHALGTNYTSVESAEMPARLPRGQAKLADAWLDCVQHDMPTWYVRTDASAIPAWCRFLDARYRHEIALYLDADARYRSRRVSAIPRFPCARSNRCAAIAVTIGEWTDFISTSAPAASLYLDTPEVRYRQFLHTRYPTLTALDSAYAAHYTCWEELYPPAIRVMTVECREHAAAIRWEFIIRNYRAVWAYMALHRHAFLNTSILSSCRCSSR